MGNANVIITRERIQCRTTKSKILSTVDKVRFFCFLFFFFYIIEETIVL